MAVPTRRQPAHPSRAALFALMIAAAFAAGACGDSPAAVTAPTRMLEADPLPPGVSVSVNAVTAGPRTMRAVADVRGAAAVQFEWYFERGPMPEVVTTANEASYTYSSTGFKDFTVRVTLADGRRVLASGAVIVE